jgi:glucosamine kinase
MFYLGIDGGGTGCRARLEDASGRAISHAQSGPANIATDQAGALANILSAAGQACEGHCKLTDAIAGLGLAGASLQGPRAWIAARLPFKSAQIVQDVETSLLGALGKDDGIVAAIGTGSVFASQRAGSRRVVGGWGLRLGDDGSGAWIGRALCRRTLASVDGFSDQTPLTMALLERLGGAQGIIAFGAQAAPSEFAALAKDVIAGVKTGDVAAVEVFDAALSEIHAAISVLQSNVIVPVAFLGGLGPIFAASLAEQFPIVAAKGTALDGALLLARQGS